MSNSSSNSTSHDLPLPLTLTLFHYVPSDTAAGIFIAIYCFIIGMACRSILLFRHLVKKQEYELPSEHVVEVETEHGRIQRVILSSKHLPITWTSQASKLLLIITITALHLVGAFSLRIYMNVSPSTLLFTLQQAYLLLCPLAIAYVNSTLILMMVRSSEQVQPILAKTQPWYLRSRSIERIWNIFDQLCLMLIPMSFTFMVDDDIQKRKQAHSMQMGAFILQLVSITHVSKVLWTITANPIYISTRPHSLNALSPPLYLSTFCISIRNLYRVISSSTGYDGTIVTWEWLLWTVDIMPLTCVMVAYIIYNPTLYWHQAKIELENKQDEKYQMEESAIASVEPNHIDSDRVSLMLPPISSHHHPILIPNQRERQR